MMLSACSLGACDQSRLQRLQRRVGGGTGIAHPQAKIGCDLIVARPRGVQPPGGFADQFFQPAFDLHMDVFKLDMFGNAARFIFGFDLVQTS